MTHYIELGVVTVAVLALLRWFYRHEPRRPNWQRRERLDAAVTAAWNHYHRGDK